jgi:geranylgeranyl transferase type-2 subunit alpha
VLKLTTKLLGKNPEYYTVWNYRRLILLHHFAEETASATAEDDAKYPSLDDLSNGAGNIITAQLNFNASLLKDFPKCYWIWNYRQWLLEQGEELLPKEDTIKLWKKELGLVGMMLNKDERNFHGWSYRQHVVAQLERLSEPGSKSLVEQEFAYTSVMIQKALQNFSALHYRSKLIPKLLKERQSDGVARRKMLEDELDSMQDALIDPFNQSAWFYHQYLISTMAEDCPREAAIVLDLSPEDRLHYYEQELERMKEMLEDFDDCKWIYEALVRYSVEYYRLTDSAPTNPQELRLWLDELARQDPMRSGRWADLRATLKI